MKKLLFWFPRLLIIAFIGFLSLFAFDVFGEGYGTVETILALLMQLVPNLLLILLLIFTWKRPLAAGVLFLIMFVFFFFMFDGYESIMQFLIIDLPLLVVSALFLLDHKYNKVV